MTDLSTRRDYRRTAHFFDWCAAALFLIPFLIAWTGSIGAESGGQKIYVANYASDSLSIFPVGSSGNAASLFVRIKLSNPSGIAYHAGNLYVADQNDSVTAYPADASGRPNAVDGISGSKTKLYNPGPLAVDAAGNISVINTGSQDEAPTIASYAAGSNGNIAPKTIIKGPKAKLDGPTAIATDTQGNLYVTTAGADRSNDSILVFAAGSSGNVSPARIISGKVTRVRSPQGIAVSAKGYIYVTTQSNSGTMGGVEILIFAPTANGNVAPISGINGDCDPTIPTAGPVAVDSDGRIYVATTELNRETGYGRPKILVFNNQLNDNPAFAPTTPPPSSLCGNVAAPTTELDSDITGTYSFAIDPTGNMYLANSDENTISILRAGSKGVVQPVAKFGGDTGIVAPTGVGLDAKGKIYVANDGVATGHSELDRLTVYPAGSNANVSPTDGFSNYSSPQALAVGADGTTYVANGTGGSGTSGDIAIFGPGPDGKPRLRTLVNAINDPSGLAVDHDGNLYVVNGGNQTITVYGPRADGEDPPLRTISGDKTGLDSPVGIALDAAGKIYVTNDGSIGPKLDSITIYAASSNGNVAPIATIAGPKTRLKLPQGIAVDANGKIYVANDGNLEDPGEEATRYDIRPRADPADSVTVYAAGSTGNVAPIARINGKRTGLGHPMGIAIGP